MSPIFNDRVPSVSEPGTDTRSDQIRLLSTVLQRTGKKNKTLLFQLLNFYQKRFCKTDLEYSFCLLQSTLTTLRNTSQHLSSSWQVSHPRSVCLRRNGRTRGCEAMVDKAKLIDKKNMCNLKARPPVDNVCFGQNQVTAKSSTNIIFS